MRLNRYNLIVLKCARGDSNDYNERIAWLRDCKSISQKEMAEKLGIKQQQYARYEKGVNVMPVTYLKPICEILNVTADYIIGLTETPDTYKGNNK